MTDCEGKRGRDKGTGVGMPARVAARMLHCAESDKEVDLESHPNLIIPPNETVLWRYMDFARFIDLLERRVLWFPRADQFDDPLEGTWTDAEIGHSTLLMLAKPKLLHE